MRGQEAWPSSGLPDGATVIAVMREGKAEGPENVDRARRRRPGARRASPRQGRGAPQAASESLRLRYPSPSVLPAPPVRARDRGALCAALAVLGFFGFELFSGPSASARPQPRSCGCSRSRAASTRRCTSRRRATSAVASTSSCRTARSSCSRTDASAPQPFLDIDSQVTSGGEQGLLSVAFHPRYAQNRLFYVNFTDNNGHTRVVEYRSDGRRRSSAFGSCSSSSSRTRTTTAARSPSGPTAACTSAWATAAPAATPRTARRTSAAVLGKLLALNVNKRGAKWQIVGARAPQPVALLLRPRHGRAVHRRRRPGRLGGDRLHAAPAAPASRTTAGTSTRAVRCSSRRASGRAG